MEETGAMLNFIYLPQYLLIIWGFFQLFVVYMKTCGLTNGCRTILIIIINKNKNTNTITTEKVESDTFLTGIE